MTNSATRNGATEVRLREVGQDDVALCAQIVFDAFGGIHDHHRFPRDFPVREAAEQMMGAWIPHPAIWGVVAESEGEIVGSNFLDERGPIRGVGPITIDPAAQARGVGRRLMEAVLDRGKDAAGIRLLQDSFNMRSLALYESLGFDLKEPVCVMNGTPRSAPVAGVEVRPMEDADLGDCAALCTHVHGFDRENELRDALQGPLAPFVALRDGRIVAYASGVSFWPLSHGVAETEEDLQALLLGAGATVEEPLALLVPLRTGFFRWCLAEGLQLVKPMNLMAMGEYREPRGAWYPSVLY